MDTNIRTTDGNDYRDFYDLPQERQQALLAWIRSNLKKSPELNSYRTSYGLKSFVCINHSIAESYFTNGQMKGAMIEAGFIAGDTDDINWIFNVDENSLDWYNPNMWRV